MFQKKFFFYLKIDISPLNIRNENLFYFMETKMNAD